MRRTFLENLYIRTPDIIRVDGQRVLYLSIQCSVKRHFADDGSQDAWHALDFFTLRRSSL
jgi:hypothetical protein